MSMKSTCSLMNVKVYFTKAFNEYLNHKTFSKTSITMEKKQAPKKYLPPKVREIPLSMENAVCGSPIPGGNEDIGYDDEWQ